MTMVNAAYGQLPPAFFFTRLNDTVAAYELAHPDKGLLRLGVGDVTGPLSLTVIEALRRAVSEQSRRETFHGYLPETGMAFFKAAVAAYYGGRNVSLSLDEIFVSSGAADDLGALGNLFSPAARVLVTEPAYPAYVDTSRMAGRKILHLQGTRENGFLPLPGDDLDADLVYLCSPNNPTGTAYTRPQLQRWVDWANDRQAVILFDAAYEAFVQDVDVPRSIYELPGTRWCRRSWCGRVSPSMTCGRRIGPPGPTASATCYSGRGKRPCPRRACSRTGRPSPSIRRTGASSPRPSGRRGSISPAGGTPPICGSPAPRA